jgi:hypothetical protein
MLLVLLVLDLYFSAFCNHARAASHALQVRYGKSFREVTLDTAVHARTQHRNLHGSTQPIACR